MLRTLRDEILGKEDSGDCEFDGRDQQKYKEEARRVKARGWMCYLLSTLLLDHAGILGGSGNWGVVAQCVYLLFPIRLGYCGVHQLPSTFGGHLSQS